MKRETKTGGLEMGAMKSWLMEHDECIGDAIQNGATSCQDVIAYCKTNMTMIDKNYIVEQWNVFMTGQDDYGLTPAQEMDLDNASLSEGN